MSSPEPVMASVLPPAPGLDAARQRPWSIGSHVHGIVARLDFVLLALAALFIGLLMFNHVQALTTAHYVARELAEIAPWLAASVTIAAAARASSADKLAARVFTGRQSRMIVVASLVGALLPFCSCGVIPLVAGLMAAGVPLAPVMAFWIASPLMDPTQFVVAAGVLGLDFAVAKMAAAVGMGLLSGFGTMALVRMGWLNAPAALRSTVTANMSSCCGSKTASRSVELGSCSSSGQPRVAAVAPSSCRTRNQPMAAPAIAWRFWEDPGRSQRFLVTATSTGWFLLRWLAIAYALESLMVAWLPVGLVGKWLGAGAGLAAVPTAVLIGIPVYLNSFASIPFVSGLVNLGMSPATGLAFMLATSATGFPAMVAVWALVKPRAFALYIGFAVIGAVLAGYAYAAVLALQS